jgi:hypothetical protein
MHQRCRIFTGKESLQDLKGESTSSTKLEIRAEQVLPGSKGGWTGEGGEK